MVQILIPDGQDSFQALKIAGDFTNWKIQPMIRQLSTTTGSWVFKITNDMVEKYCTEELQDQVLIHFKFIDDNNNWFTSDNFDLVSDENNNINNAVMLEFSNGKLKEEDKFVSENESVSSRSVTPVTPAPTLEINTPVIETNTIAKEDNDVLDTLKVATPELVELDEDVYFSPNKEKIKENNTQDEDEAVEDSTIPVEGSENDNKLLGIRDQTHYKTFLQRFIDFFWAFFGSWAKFFKNNNETSTTLTSSSTD